MPRKPIPNSTSPSRSKACSANAAAPAWCKAATTSRCRPRIRSSAISWTRSRAAAGSTTRTSPGCWSRPRRSRIRELETELGCFFDRNPDGTVHQKAFAGQTFDRTVHKGDLDRHRDHQSPGRTGVAARRAPHRGPPRARSHPDRRRQRARRRLDARHAHGRAAVGARARDAAGDRRRADDVPLSHAVRRQVLRRAGHGAARRPALARHRDGAIPSDRACSPAKARA